MVMGIRRFALLSAHLGGSFRHRQSATGIAFNRAML